MRNVLKVLIGVTLLFTIILMGSCEVDQTTIMAPGGGGDFLVINVTTNDTVKITSGINISVNGSSLSSLNVKKGDKLKLKFIPVDDYSKYAFDVTYTLQDLTEVKAVSPDYEYEYVLDGVDNGKYRISMSARYEKDKDKKFIFIKTKEENIFITAGGSVYLNVSE